MSAAPQHHHLDVEIRNHPAIRSIRELRGSLALWVSGEHRQVVVPKAFSRLNKAVASESLKASRITRVAVAREPKSMWRNDPNVKDRLGFAWG